MYFTSFPKVQYTNILGGQKQTVTDILKRIAARQAVKNNATFFTKYRVRGNESPENLAFDLYNDAELHWVILLTNDIYDRYHQWPMNNNQFLTFVNDKYTDVNAVHHYEITQTSGDTTIKIDIGQDNTDHPTATSVTNYEYEENRQDELRQIKLLREDLVGQFVSEYISLHKTGLRNT